MPERPGTKSCQGRGRLRPGAFTRPTTTTRAVAAAAAMAVGASRSIRGLLYAAGARRIGPFAPSKNFYTPHVHDDGSAKGFSCARRAPIINMLYTRTLAYIYDGRGRPKFMTVVPLYSLCRGRQEHIYCAMYYITAESTKFKKNNIYIKSGTLGRRENTARDYNIILVYSRAVILYARIVGV